MEPGPREQSGKKDKEQPDESGDAVEFMKRKQAKKYFNIMPVMVKMMAYVQLHHSECFTHLPLFIPLTNPLLFTFSRWDN